ncbi:MAG: hypothetical protein WCI47_02655 [bacterium]
MNKSKILSIAIASLGIATVVGIGAVSAAQSTSGKSLADAIAARFNVNKTEVQQVIDQHRDEKKQGMEQNYEKRLQGAVDDKKLTSEQRDKLLAKHKELFADMQSQRDALKDKTPAERKAAMQAKRDEVTQWEKDNNIPAGYLNGSGMSGPGMHGRDHMMNNDKAPEGQPDSK